MPGSAPVADGRRRDGHQDTILIGGDVPASMIEPPLPSQPGGAQPFGVIALRHAEIAILTGESAGRGR
jgi:hypothetical protein